MTLAVFAVLCGTVALTLMWKRPRWRRTQAWLMLIVGLGLAAGFADRARDNIIELATNSSATATQKVFGVGVPFAVALFLVIWWALDMDFDGLVKKVRKKGPTPKRGQADNAHTTTWFTPWLALLVPPSLAIVPFLANAPTAMIDGVNSLSGMLG